MNAFTSRVKGLLPKDDRKRLWLIAGVLFVCGNCYKFLVWSVAEKEILGQADATHIAATQHLSEVKQASGKFNLPPLSASEKRQLSERST